jgi:twitching motility protein PilT
MAIIDSTNDGQSRRTAKRRHIFIPIVCREIRDGKPSGPNIQISVRDLGEDGLGFKSKTIYSIGLELQSEVYLPSRKFPVTPTLKIERVDVIAGTDHYMIGASFSKIEPEHKKAILECFEGLDLYKILDEAQKVEASDIHLTIGQPAVFRHRGRLSHSQTVPIGEGQIRAMLFPLLNETQIENFEKNKELDFAFSPNLETRYRVNLHIQKGFAEAALRNIPSKVPDFQKLGLPAEQLQRFCQEKAGLILISGKTGAGKTTTLTAMIDFVNKNLEKVVITIEDPIEYVHKSQKSIIKQRELGSDTRSYAEALKHSLRQDPDIIVVSELLDGESVRSAMRAAETGHLVISTIHAPDTSQTVERILNMFPPEHANSVCQQLASCLNGIMFQTLVPSKKGHLVAATELLVANNAIRTLIREGRFAHIGFSIQTGASQSMYTLETCFRRLVQDGLIEESVANENLKTI